MFKSRNKRIFNRRHHNTITFNIIIMSCHLCNYWTPENGCNHYGPDSTYALILAEIVAATHSGNYLIIETTDFKSGAFEALKYLENKGIINTIKLTTKLKLAAKKPSKC